MPNPPPATRYDPAECVVFYRTRELWGELSNMRSDYPLVVGPVPAESSEALYQCLRFPHSVEIQREILAHTNPMRAKMTSKKHRAETRADWMEVRVPLMEWTLRVKFALYPSLRSLLRSTSPALIVERSARDPFWGAVPTADGHLLGMNQLGLLLMRLRDEMLTGQFRPGPDVAPPAVPGCFLLGAELPPVRVNP